MLIKASFVALAAVIAPGSIDMASAAKKKKRTYRDRPALNEQEQRKRGFNRDLGINYDADGTPIIMRSNGSHSKKARTSLPEAGEPALRADRPRPRGSSTYIRRFRCPVRGRRCSSSSANRPSNPGDA